MTKAFSPTKEELLHAIKVRPENSIAAAKYLGVANCTFIRACNRLGVPLQYHAKQKLYKQRQIRQAEEKEENREKKHPFRRALRVKDPDPVIVPEYPAQVRR